MRRIVASFTFSAVAAAALLAMSGTAAAQDDQDPAEDTRAVLVEGNLKASDCPTLWPGSTAVIDHENSDESLKYIDITEEDVPEGVELVGVVVKGGDNSNKYSAEDLGDLPWEDLRSPLKNDKVPAVSHWFACGVKTTTTTTTTTTTDETTTTTAATTTTDATTTTSGETTTTTTVANATTSTTVAPVVNENDLPDTGANVGWLLFLGAALLLGGGALMAIPRVRSAILSRF